MSGSDTLVPIMATATLPGLLHSLLQAHGSALCLVLPPLCPRPHQPPEGEARAWHVGAGGVECGLTPKHPWPCPRVCQACPTPLGLYSSVPRWQRRRCTVCITPPTNIRRMQLPFDGRVVHCVKAT